MLSGFFVSQDGILVLISPVVKIQLNLALRQTRNSIWVAITWSWEETARGCSNKGSQLRVVLGCICISGGDEDKMIIFSWKKIGWGKKEETTLVHGFVCVFPPENVLPLLEPFHIHFLRHIIYLLWYSDPALTFQFLGSPNVLFFFLLNCVRQSTWCVQESWELCFNWISVYKMINRPTMSTRCLRFLELRIFQWKIHYLEANLSLCEYASLHKNSLSFSQNMTFFF